MEASSTTRRGDRTAAAIRQAAVRLFKERGYEATTLRDLSAEVGITVGSVYNHIASKEDLLFAIMSGIMRDILDGLEAVLAGLTDPVDRIRAAVEYHVTFHAERADEVFIGNSELRSLPPVRRAAVVEARDAYDSTFRELIEEGIKKKRFFTNDARLVSNGIIAMGTHVSDWYVPGGRLSLDEIASVYSDFVLRGLTNPSEQVKFGDVMNSARTRAA